MDWLNELLTTHLVVFTLVLARVGGVVVTAPLFSLASLPANVRAVLAFALALLVAPAQIEVVSEVPQETLAWLVALGIEALIGMALGLGTAIILAGAQMAGQLAAQVSGLSLAEVFDPALETNVSVLSHLLGLLTLVVYLGIGGQRWLMAGLLDTFHALPVGNEGVPQAVSEVLVTLVSESLSLGLRAAMPAVVALLLASLILALVGRTMTQLNVMSVGFGLNALVAFSVVAISLGSMAWLFEEQLQGAIVEVVDALTTTAAPAAAVQ